MIFSISISSPSAIREAWVDGNFHHAKVFLSKPFLMYFDALLVQVKAHYRSLSFSTSILQGDWSTHGN